MSEDTNERMPGDYDAVLADVVTLLEEARRQAARSVNAILTAAYWEIGRRLVEVEQAGEARAGYSEHLLAGLSGDLSARFGRGFSERNLRQMRQFYTAWPIRQTLSAESQRGDSAGPGKVQIPPAQLSDKVQTPSGQLNDLAAQFPLACFLVALRPAAVREGRRGAAVLRRRSSARRLLETHVIALPEPVNS